MKYTFALLLTFTAFFVNAQQTTTNTTETAMTATAIYTYYDGNNNQYIIQPGLIEYKPVQPPESSSGVYSGGAPARKELNAAQYTEMEAVLRSVIANTTEHSGARAMGSGLILEHNTSKGYILKPDAKAKQELEAYLKKVLEP